MAELKILTYPHPFLQTIAKPVKKFDDQLKNIADQMIEAMRQHSGIGLAATQVGIDKQIFVMEISDDSSQLIAPKQPMIIINPKIIDKEGTQVMDEGCLSVPECRGKVKRHAKLTLEYQDLKGDKYKMEAERLLAVCIQHEFDHLQGKLFIDRLPSLSKKIIKTKLKKQLARQ